MSDELDPGGAGDAAAEPPPQAPAGRPFALSVLLFVIVALSTLIELKAMTGRDEMFRLVPSFTPRLYALWVSAPPIAIAGAAGLWFMRRWGFYLLGLSWALTVIVDVLLGATNHAFLATGVMWLLVIFTRAIRASLR